MSTTTQPIKIFDTTLRDGEQSPGASLNLKEKLEIARALEQLGVDIIEAGFPITSQGDFEAVSAVAAEITASTIAALARCTEKDVRRAGEAIKHAKSGRIHVFLATSKIHREFKLKKAKEEIIRMTKENVALAREYVSDVEFSPEDASRTELDFLAEVVHAAIEAGATTINCPDTVGFATPAEHREMFEYLLKNVPGAGGGNVIFSAHCHNDLGLAVANSLAAVQGGARQVECTINGIGERAGNASLEEIVMTLKTRHDAFPFTTRINTQKIVPISRLVSSLTGLHVQRNKAIVGENAFAHESGIHQDGMLKHKSTYEIMTPSDVGWANSRNVLGKHSGRHAFKTRLDELGYRMSEEMLNVAFDKFKTLCDKKKEIYDADLEAIVEDQMENAEQLFKLKCLQVVAGTIPTATVTLIDATGAEITDAATGDGPIDAMFAVIQRITHISAQLVNYEVRSVTAGKDALGEATVELIHSDRKVRGRGVSTDILEASAKAYLAAINRIRTITKKTVSQATPI